MSEPIFQKTTQSDSRQKPFKNSAEYAAVELLKAALSPPDFARLQRGPFKGLGPGGPLNGPRPQALKGAQGGP